MIANFIKRVEVNSIGTKDKRYCNIALSFVSSKPINSHSTQV